MLKSIPKTILLICTFLCSTICVAQHNYEFYNNGALFYTSATSDMYVMGDFHSVAASDMQHNGLVEVQGNLYGSNTMRQTGTGTFRLRNSTVNVGQAQTIYGANGFAVRGGYAQVGTANDGSFYDLVLSNDLGTVYLSGGGYVADVRNSVNFNPGLGAPVNRIITCSPPPSAIPTNGSLYPSIFGIMSRTATLSTVMSNNTVTTNGNTSAIDNGYVQGKLRRAIDPAGGTYGYVLGLEPSAAGPNQKGMQYIHLNFAGANTYDVVTGYFESGSDNTVAGYWNECSGYLIDYFGGVDHGEWVFNQMGGNTGTYEVKIWPQNDNFTPQTVWLITKDNAIDGTADDCGASAVALDRAGFSGFSEFGAAGSNTIDPLPIELIELAANPYDNHTIRVNWSTATETNVSHFVIERSIDAVNFDSVGRTESPGNCTTVRDYIFDDVNCVPNQLYYYRIKTVDLDHSYNNTYIVHAIIENTLFGDNVMIYPNPMNGTHIEMLYKGIGEQDLHVKIINSIGQLIYEEQFHANDGDNHFSIIPPQMAKGLYFIEIGGTNAKQAVRVKLIRN